MKNIRLLPLKVISLLSVFSYFACFFAITLVLVNSNNISAQNLTVRQIMAEPSLAGMRPDSEKLSPDGAKVVFSWNADGKEPRNLYIWAGGEPRILVNAEQNFEPRTTPPESKLNYGLIVRDDFVKAREKNLGGVEFSPDSKKILFLQNSDIYVLDLDSQAETSILKDEKIRSYWESYQSNIIRRADLIEIIIHSLRMGAVVENKLYNEVLTSKQLLIDTINNAPKLTTINPKTIISLNEQFDVLINQLKNLPKSYPRLSTNEPTLKVFDELQGVENRINVARIDYEESIKTAEKKSAARRITRTQGSENSARWLTNDSILYSSAGNFFVLNLKETSLVQVTKEANPAAFVSIFGVNPTKDGKMIAYTVSDGSRQKALFVPNYLDEFTVAPTTRRGWTDQRIYAYPTDGSRETPFEVKLPKAEGVSYIRSVKWAADNASLIVDRIDKDTKRRQLFYVHNVGSKAEHIILLTEETDEKWVAGLSRIVEPNPQNAAQVFFGSERDGFNHLYKATLERLLNDVSPNPEARQTAPMTYKDSVKIEQVTKGKYEIDWAKWAGTGDQIIFSSTEETTAERQFYAYEMKTKEKLKIYSQEKGMRNNPQIDETIGNQPNILFQFSKWNSPSELYIQKICTGCRGLNAEQKITNSIPETFNKTAWSEPKFIDIPSRDGKIIKSKIYLPNSFDKTKKYPMVIFVHGAGYLQNTINGWNNYYREFMFHTLLTQKGYVILDIDFRGSAGYGRDWRTDVHDFLGGKDYEDHLDAIDYSVKNYSVNPKKVGVYGGSYGGFMAEMLAFRTDKITCAAALRPVADWKNYYASSNIYTTERLGFPDKNPEAYKRSSPIAYAEGLNKPLLILHGLVDDNVHAQDSIQLIEKLMRLEKTKYFDAMLYPAENHGFARPTSWADEYERILDFFEKNLRN